LAEVKSHSENQEEIVARTMGFMFILDLEKNRPKRRQARDQKQEEEYVISGIYSDFICWMSMAMYHQNLVRKVNGMVHYLDLLYCLQIEIPSFHNFHSCLT
jgi:hypothetical protein